MITRILIIFLLYCLPFYDFAQQTNKFDEELFKLNVTAIAKVVLRNIDSTFTSNQLEYYSQSVLNNRDISQRIVIFKLKREICFCCLDISHSSCFFILVVDNPTKYVSDGFMYRTHFFYENFEDFIDVNGDGQYEMLVGGWDYRGMGIMYTYTQSIIEIQDKVIRELAVFYNFGLSVTHYSKQGDVMLGNYSNFKVLAGRLYVFFEETTLLTKNEETLDGTYHENIYLEIYQYDSQKQALVRIQKIKLN